MEAGHTSWYRTAFENKFLKLKRETFQDLFAEIMERAHPGDFARIRPSVGDHGCDGYLQSKKTVFQVYAPRAIQRAKLTAKIAEDFAKAREHFGPQMEQWIFVHNDRDGLSAETVKQIKDLETDHPGVSTGSWDYERLWEEIKGLPDERLAELLLPPIPAPTLSPERMAPARHKDSSGKEPPPTGVITASARAPAGKSPAQHRILLELIDAQSESIRQLLDEKGLALWQDIRQCMATLSFAEAIDKGKDLERWLLEEGNKASAEVRGRALVLLADLTLVESLDSATGDSAAVARARIYYDRARNAFGPEISNEDSLRLIALAAKLDAVQGNVAQALRNTEGVQDPSVVFLHLAILVEQQDWAKAAVVLEENPLHENWSDLAAIVYVECDEMDKAEEVLSWAKKKNTLRYHRCLLHFVKTIVGRRQQKLQREGPIVPGRLSRDDADLLREALSMLQPLLYGPVGSEQVSTGIEAESLAVAVTITYQLGETEDCRKYVGILNNYCPVHLTVAQAVLAGIVDAPAGLPGRLRHDHPTSTDALTLAAWIEGTRLGKPSEAVASVQGMVAQSSSFEERQRLCELLCELYSLLESETREEADTFLSEHLGSDHPLVLTRRVALLLDQQNTDAAERLLASLRDEDDPLYLQLNAQLQCKKGDICAAAESQMAAARLLSRVEVWRTAVGFAEEACRSDLLAEALQSVLTYAPDDDRARFKLGALFIKQQRFADAADCFRTLWDRTPDDLAFGLNLAICLRNDGRSEEALDVLHKLCDRRFPSPIALLHRAQILRELHKPDSALQSLEPFCEELWSNVEFLLAYVGFAYAAGRDDIAHEAFRRVFELEREGRIPPDTLWTASMEETVELIRKHDETVLSANKAVLRGQLPWLVVERLRRFPPYLGWRFRTQEMTVSDSIDARATFAVYSTNCFTVQDNGGDPPNLQRICCADRGSNVVIDSSALISLHRLGLLAAAMDYFGRIQVPSLYFAAMADDSVDLAPHQPSLPQSWRAIMDEKNSGRISILPEANGERGTAVPIVAEFYDEDKAPEYHLIDLLNWLMSIGQLSSGEYEQAKTVARKAPRAEEQVFTTRSSAGVEIAADSLRAIHEVGLLDAVVRSIRVYLSHEDLCRIEMELKGAAARNEVLTWHEDLATILKNEARIERAIVPRILGDGKSPEDPRMARPWAALAVAQDQDLTLFADDRHCQAAILHVRRHTANAAFGTDAFILALLREGTISISDAARCFEKLMSWRYRFLLPPPTVLQLRAREYGARPPGPRLVAIAQYMHDCMRDPGLFNGPEATEPSVSVGWRLWLAWIHVLADFLIGVRLDPEVGDAVAQEFAKWTVMECLPSPPANLHAHARRSIAERTSALLLNRMLAHPALIENEAAVNAAIVAVKDAMGLSDLQYLRAVEKLTHVRRRTER